VAFVAGRAGKPDAELRRVAEELGIPFIAPEKVNAPDFVAWVAGQGLDVNVSMSFDQILKSPILASARRGFVNCHAGALPFYRGRNILNWAIINGESRFGVTVHFVDEGIDTGDILLQRFAPIGADDDYGTVLTRAHALCAETLHDALALIASGRDTRTPQATIHPVGFYCGARKPGDEALDWSLPSQRVHNFVRAITIPGPGARTWCKDRELAILKTRLIPGAPPYLGTCGEVVGRSAEGVVVKTGDSTLLVQQIAPVAEDGTLGEATTPSHPIGTRLRVHPG
jgi:methionyl-tRNA formyltransferase